MCFNATKLAHAGSDNTEHSVVSNELGRRITLCGECVAYLMPCVECGLCEALCVGPTLKVVDPPTALKKCSLSKEVFCYECVGNRLPKFMSKFFQENPDAIEEVFGEYYAINEERIDFSTPDTIVLEWNGKTYRRGMENQMSALGHALYKISRYAPKVGVFVRDVFIPEMRARRYEKKCCYVQTIREQRIADGLATIAHFVPLSEGHPRASELLPSRYVRKGTPRGLREMRDTNDFDSFLDFLKDN